MMDFHFEFPRVDESLYVWIGSTFGFFLLYFLLRPLSSSPSLGRRVFQLGGMALCLLTLLPGTAGDIFATAMLGLLALSLAMLAVGLVFSIPVAIVGDWVRSRFKKPQSPPRNTQRKFFIPQFSLQELILMVISIAVAPGVIPLLLPQDSRLDELQFFIAVIAVCYIPPSDLILLKQLAAIQVPICKTRSALLFLCPFLFFCSLYVPARLFYFLKAGRLEQGAGVAETICQIAVAVLIIIVGAILLRRARVLADAGREKPPEASGSQEKG